MCPPFLQQATHTWPIVPPTGTNPGIRVTLTPLVRYPSRGGGGARRGGPRAARRYRRSLATGPAKSACLCCPQNEDSSGDADLYCSQGSGVEPGPGSADFFSRGSLRWVEALALLVLGAGC